MRHPGIERKKLKDEMKAFPTLVKIHRGEHIETKSKRNPRAPETKKRNMTEKALEKKIIIALKMMGCEVSKAGESSVYNSNFCLSGVADLIVFIPKAGIMFMEVKTESKQSKQRETQIQFESLCLKTGVKYVVVRSVEEARARVREVMR